MEFVEQRAEGDCGYHFGWGMLSLSVETGSVNSGEQISYMPKKTGSYAVVVTARDEGGAVLPAQTSMAVTVTPTVTLPESEHPCENNFDQTWWIFGGSDVIAPPIILMTAPDSNGVT